MYFPIMDHLKTNYDNHNHNHKDPNLANQNSWKLVVFIRKSFPIYNYLAKYRRVMKNYLLK